MSRWIFAGKTGYTTDALNTLVTCGKRNDMDVIVVSMRTRSTGEKGVPLFTDTAALLDYANNFQKLNISENETTFVLDNAYDFSIASNDLTTSASLISIDQDSCVILPNTASFSDAIPSISLEEGNQAYLTYQFAGQEIGKASITLEENTEKEFEFSEVESAANEDKTNYITINIKIILIVLAGIAIFLLLILFFYKIYLKNRAKLRQAINLYEKRRMLRRRRYRRRKKHRR